MSANAPNTGQIVPFKARVNDLRSTLDGMKEQFAQALPAHVKVDRLLRMALTAVQKQPELLDCSRNSFLLSLLECAQLGLEPNTTLGHAWLIPFWNSKQKRLDAQLVPGYKGLIKLAYQSGMVASIGAHFVREKDEFDYKYGLRPRLTHKPCRTPDAGEMVACYAVAEVRGVARPIFKVLERWECEEIRKRFSKSPNKGPWVDNFEDMSMKSAIRRNLKLVPTDTEKNMLARAIDHDERAEAGISQEFSGDLINLGPESVTTPEGDAAEPGKPAEGTAAEQPTAEQPAQGSKLDQLAAEARAKQAARQS